MHNKIYWLGHSSIKIKGDKTVYIDPWKLRDSDTADLILISHSHGDHLSPGDVEKIHKDDTVIITTEDCAAQLSGDVRVITPGDEIQVGEIKVEAVPSYNTNKAFHPRQNKWVGFIITMEGSRIYYCGDTDFIPEMREIEADIMIVPVGGTYTMTAEEAAEAVNLIKPGIAIPVHYGDIVGSIKDAKKFKDLCEVPVEIKTPHDK